MCSRLLTLMPRARSRGSLFSGSLFVGRLFVGRLSSGQLGISVVMLGAQRPRSPDLLDPWVLGAMGGSRPVPGEREGKGRIESKGCLGPEPALYLYFPMLKSNKIYHRRTALRLNAVGEKRRVTRRIWGYGMGWIRSIRYNTVRCHSIHPGPPGGKAEVEAARSLIIHCTLQCYLFCQSSTCCGNYYGCFCSRGSCGVFCK